MAMIKPSVPTPSHLKTYNLSALDQFIPISFIPLVAFYPKPPNYHSSHDQILDLKNSLPRTLTKYYPFAGRHAKIAPTYIDCNDHGAEFVEATVDTTVTDFLRHSQPEDLDQLFPYGRVWTRKTHDQTQTDTVIPLAVKVNRFKCGGVAVAVSLSHKIADGYSLIRFVNDWAKLTRVCFSKTEKLNEPDEPDPVFISFQNTCFDLPLPSHVLDDCVTRCFVFPNEKLNELKLKVTAMTVGTDHHIVNPTRVEVLTWLLYKRAVSAATRNNSGSFTPSRIGIPADIRNKMMEPLPDNCIGNFLTGLEVQTNNETELQPEFLITELRKQKTGIQGLKNLETFLELFKEISPRHFETLDTRNDDDNFICTSFCGFPLNGMDFGWGSPMKVTFAGNMRKNSFTLMDSSKNQEGIEALVCLGKQEMGIFQQDPQLLAFC